MHRTCFVLLLIVISFSKLNGQNNEQVALNESVQFHRLTTEQGLPHDKITALLQDTKGFMWIGTINGLSRFDGSRFFVYKNDPADTFSISDNNITNLSLDSNGRIWVGTYWQGLNLLDEGTHKFISFKNQPKVKPLFSNNFIPSVRHLDNTHIAIAQGDLLILDIKTRTSEFIALPQNTWKEKIISMAPDRFNPYEVFIDHEKKWWLTGETGIVQYDPVLKKMNLFSLRKDIPDVLNKGSTYGCQEDNDGNIWIGGGGLFEYDRASNKFIQHYPSRFLPADIKTKWVKTVLCSKDGTIWFGTNNGLFHYFPETGKYFVYLANPKHFFSISDNDINCLYEDKQGILWIGTGNGLNAVYPQTSAFGVYQNIPGEKNSLQSDVTMASFKDDKENIWVGTSKGLECIDQATGNVTQYQFIDPHLKDQWQYFVMPIFQQDASSFWVGTWGAGMQLFDFKKRKFIASYAHFSNSPLSISSNFIHAFCKDSRGNLWITTWNGGVDRFDPRKHIFEHFTTTNKKINFDYLNKICFAYNTIWAGNREGLVKYDSLTNKFHLFRITNDSTNIFSSAVGEITPDGKGNLWIGSFKGLIKFDCNTNRFKKIEAVGNSEVSGVLIESESEIWLTTSEGVKLYNPVTEKLTTYSLKDGLPISYFAGEFYSYKAPDGEIFLSSNNGLIHFRPENIRRNDSKPSLFITSVKIENKELEGLGDVNQLRYLKLNYNQNYLTLGFAAMNFINPGQNKYAYKLEGVDNEWVFSGNRNEAIYTNLSPGDYVFRIKGSNDAGIWNEEGVTLNIHINTPWWRTWWFYGLCFITVMAIGYSLYRIRISRIIGEQKLRNKIARDLHDDIGSTLSGIKLFSSMAQNKLMQENSEALNIVERITERSEKMIDAMSDIVWSINPVNDSIENMFVRMKQHAAEMFEPRNISFRFNSEESITKMKIPLEIRKDIYLIFKESINNAVKHANCKNVFINLDIQQKNFKMTIIDDGIGFDIKELNGKGNGLGNFSERAKNIGGKINISSMPGKGTNVELVVLVT